MAPTRYVAATKTESVCIPNAHLRRGSDATVSRDINLIPELQHSFKHQAPILFASTAHHGVHVAGANASDEEKKPIFQLLAAASEPITPALLAKHHLPGILLQHGPLAIRHITAHLIASVPGFSSIPPAKQRRIVVGALEGRGGCSGTMGEVGGVNGDVIFEKVGWGRWDARRKGDPPRELLNAPVSPPLSATRFDKDGLLSDYSRAVAPEMRHSHSYTGESGIFLQSEEESTREDIDMDDAMSLTGDSSTSEDDDMTDEEDWAQMGAAALRQHGGSPITSDGWGHSYNKSPRSDFVQWQKEPIETPEQKRSREEREAVEALLKLGSV